MPGLREEVIMEHIRSKENVRNKSKTKTKHDPNVFLYTNGQVKSMYKYHGDIERFILYSKEFFNIP